MTNKIPITQKTSNQDLVNDITGLLLRQQEEIQQLKQQTGNQLAEVNALRQLKLLHSQFYVGDGKQIPSLSFAKTTGTNISIDKNKAHLFAKEHTLLHLQSNSVCTWIPKVGCTNMRYSIPLANGAISTPEDIEWVHSNNNSFTADNKELLKANYAFVVLRNPFKRLVSFFLDKLCHDDPNLSDKSYSVAKKLFKASESTSFLDFVKTLWLEPELINADIHVKPQTDFLIYNKYSDYFCLENYEQAIAKIFEKIGLKVIDTRGMGSGNTTYRLVENNDITYNTKSSEISALLKIGQKPNIKNMYSDEICKMVGVLFLPDIILYLNEVENSKNEMSYWMNRIIQL